MTKYQYDFLQEVYPKTTLVFKEYDKNGVQVVKTHEKVRNLDMDIYNLYIDGVLWMCSNTTDYLDHRCIMDEFYGDILLTGLGLGLGRQFAQMNMNVRSVTIIERDPRIIEMLHEQLNEPQKKLTVIEADAYNWVPEKWYDCAYHDVVYDPNDLDSYRKLRNKYANNVGDQYFWGYEYTKVTSQYL